MGVVVITGAAGFIGSHLTERCLAQGWDVIGIDNFNDYYDPSLKEARFERLEKIDHQQRFKMIRADLQKSEQWIPRVDEILGQGGKPDVFVNLAAQAGVRYSLENPHAYIDSNITGFLNVLEFCRHREVGHLVYASSSSVYGANGAMPFSESQIADHPISLYGVTKRSNELMAHSYSDLFGLPTTGLRFFTVYGPWGRPDMSLFLFTRNILAGEPIQVFNHGQHRRDFTYVDDIVEGVYRIIDRGHRGADESWDPQNPNPSRSRAPFRVYNIGSSSPVDLMDFVRLIEENVGREAEIEYLPMQAGDVEKTFSDTSALREDYGYAPSTPIEVGVERFVSWYREYFS